MPTDPAKPPAAGLWSDQFHGPLLGRAYREHLLDATEAKAQADFALKLLGIAGRQPRRLLDVACGYGRHARRLAASKSLSMVAAIDLNLGYLVEARRGLRGATARRLAPARADMRRLPLRAASFDAAVLLFNSFGYFGSGEWDQQASEGESKPGQAPIWKLPSVFYEKGLVEPSFGQSAAASPAGQPVDCLAKPTAPSPSPGGEDFIVLQEIARVLRPGGRLLMEAPNPRPLIEAVRKMPRRHVVAPSYEVEEEFAYDDATKTLSCRSRIKMGREEEDGQYRLRLYSLKELTTLLGRAGLSRVDALGSYEGEPYEPRNSDLILALAQKE